MPNHGNFSIATNYPNGIPLGQIATNDTNVKIRKFVKIRNL